TSTPIVVTIGQDEGSGRPFILSRGCGMSLDVQARQPELEPTVLDTEPASADGSTPGVEGAAAVVEAAPRVAPVSAAERLFAVDVLRGFALLGILAMN